MNIDYLAWPGCIVPRVNLLKLQDPDKIWKIFIPDSAITLIEA